MSNVMEIIVRAVDQASNVLNNIGKQGEQATKNLEKSFKNTGKAMTNAGKTLSTHVTAPLAGLATVSVATVAKFDDSMSQVAAISGATGKDLERLRDLAKDLGATTRYSASEAADAMTYLALAGYDTNQILEATPGMLNLAAAAGMDLATAADIVTDTMSGFQMSAERAGEAADIFAAASSKSNTNVEQLGEAMKYAASTANAAGMDLAQTAAILGIFADSGVKGSMAGTTFNAILRDMKNKAKDGTIAVGDMSIALYNADGTMRDLGSIMADVEQATKNMTTAQRDAALGAVFGSEALRGVNILLATGSERYKELEQAMYNSTGASQKMAETMEGNVAGAFREFKSQVEGIMIQIGEQLAPILRDTIIPLLSGFGEKISNLIEWFAGLDEGTKRTIITILGIVAAVGPVLLILGKVVGAVGTIIGIFSKLKVAWSAVTVVSNLFNASLLANPITWIIAGIMALIAAIVLLWKNWDTVSQWLSNSWEWLKETATAVFQAIADFFTGIWESIKNTAITIWDGIIQFFTVTVPEAFMTLVNWFAALPGEIISFLSQLPETIAYWIGFALGTAVRLVSEGITAVINFFASLPGKIAEFVTNVYNTVINFFASLPGKIAEFVTNVYNTITQWFTNAKNTAINLATGLVNGVVSFFTSLPGRIATIVMNFKNAIVNGFNAAKSWAVSAANNLVNGVRSAISAIPGIFTTIWSNVISFVSSLPGKLWQKAKSIASSFWEGFKKGLGIHSPSYVEEAFFAIAEAAKESVAVTTRAVQGINRQLQPSVTSFGTIPTGVLGTGEGAGGTIGFNIPKIPYLERGGFIRGGNPTPAVIGEGRYDEAVIPLSDSVLSKLAEMIASKMNLAGAGAGGGELVITVPVYLDSREIARATTPHISKNLMRQQFGRDSARGRR